VFNWPSSKRNKEFDEPNPYSATEWRPREIFDGDTVPAIYGEEAIKAWLQLHRRPGDGSTPLEISNRERIGTGERDDNATDGNPSAERQSGMKSLLWITFLVIA